jgi:hypothetical protein
MIIGNPNTFVRDRHPLWKGFENNKYEKPFMHGVVGSQWRVPVSEDDRGYKLIASPMPKPDIPITRIQPTELPPNTYSSSAYDVPFRRDVIQTEIPQATIRTVETRFDPRFPPKKPVQVVHGTLYHGTGSTDPKIVHGLARFAEKKSKKQVFHHTDHSLERAHASAMKNEGLNIAKNTEQRSTDAMYRLSHNIEGENHMVLNVDVLNRRDTPDLKLYENNKTLQERIHRLRYTPAGVRAANTLRKLP